MKRKEYKKKYEELKALKGQDGGEMLPGAGKAGAFRQADNRQERRQFRQHLRMGIWED